MTENVEDKRQEPSAEASETSDSNFSSDESLYKQKTDTYWQKKVSTMSQADQHRYETFRRSNFVKGAIKKYINQIIGQAVNPNIVIGVSGLAKVFVGELVTEALEVQEEYNHTGALLPLHIHEAMRRITKKMPNTSITTKAPWDTNI